MKILWHGVAPWQPTGYGQQAAIWCKRLQAAGHEVVISAQGGSSMCGIIDWEGLPVLPSANEIEAVALVSRYHIEQVKPDLAITLYDGWQMGPGSIFKGYRTVAWLPVDTSWVQVGAKRPGGVAVLDKQWLETSGATPIAMSEHGRKMLRHAGYDPELIPHGIDLDRWPVRDDDERDDLRRQLGGQRGTFMVGINATNIDPHRKSLSEQFLAFARFHAKHPASKLHVHSMVHNPGSLYLDKLAKGCGIPQEAISIAHQGLMYTGTFPQEDLARWYASMDVVMNCARGEGFGLAAVESQACGTPVILTDAHTGPELVGPGWLVGTQPFWNWTHEAWWHTPVIADIEEALEDALGSAYQLRDRSRKFAEQFSADLVWPLWEKIIDGYATQA